MLRKNSLLMLLVILIVGISILGGCDTAKKPMTDDPPPTTQTETTENTPVYDTARANQVAMEAAKVNGVNKANVLISNNNIYIGLDLKPGKDKNQSTSIEKAVTDQVKASQPGNNVFVTTDPDLVTRITTIANGIAQGTPLTTFTDEMELIGNRLNPQQDFGR